MSVPVRLPFDVLVDSSVAAVTIRTLLPALDEAQLKLLLEEIGERVGAVVNWGTPEVELLLRVRDGIAKLPGDKPETTAGTTAVFPIRQPGKNWPPRAEPEAS
ncbi:hypothetical protein ACIGXM_14445 [Kitasatospora sp. NPDC052896]|uniref:hypothetical protein n=1 Tax=Kitasatospora sp. NPDC052896 TaxID=3364061 RepID=UPI0037C5188F